MSVNINESGVVKRLDRDVEPPMPLTPSDVTEPETLVRVLRGLIRDVGVLVRRWSPRHIDYERREVLGDGTTMYRFEHRFGGSARYWVVSWSGAAAPNLCEHATSDDNTLVLTSTSAGTATIRVEQAG